MTRFSPWLAALVLSVASGLVANAADPTPTSQPDSRPEVLLLQLLRPIDAARNIRQIIMDDPYGGSNEPASGTKIVLQVALPPDVVEVPKSINLSTFTDDKGTSLGLGTKKIDAGRGFESQPIYVLPNQSKCILKFYSSSLPDRGASEIRIKGKLPVGVGRGEKTFTQSDLLFRLGKTIEAGPIKLTISALSEGERHGDVNPEGLLVAFTSANAIDQLKSLTFLDADGKAIAAKEEYRANDPAGSYNKLASFSCTLAKRPRSANVRIVTYEKVETVEIPLELTIKVGL